MGKLITIGILVAVLVMYSHYIVEMQQRAMNNFHNIEYVYAHAEESATKLK